MDSERSELVERLLASVLERQWRERESFLEGIAAVAPDLRAQADERMEKRATDLGVPETVSELLLQHPGGTPARVDDPAARLELEGRRYLFKCPLAELLSDLRQG